ncbi:MAG: hypothetical protein BAJALOKI1v1_270023 [Promethearchaeota archaeon]|nr:MAG: hypothetical protein BAJALOKI1v1_270023 [Candidatus Lokiarchaeota archaeon]
MVFGGSLNERGTNYLRKLHEVHRVLEFLETFKDEVNSNQKQVIDKTIKILVQYITKMAEGKESDHELD